jgi:hypothetical protein
VGSGGGHVIRKNLFFSPGRTSISGKPGDFTASDNLEDKDPLFTDADRFDFRLREGSPAIGFGAPAFPSTRGAAPAPPASPRETKQASGPLRVHPTNPRYFTDGTKLPDGSLKAVYLTGSHTWGNLCDALKGRPGRQRHCASRGPRGIMAPGRRSHLEP